MTKQELVFRIITTPQNGARVRLLDTNGFGVLIYPIILCMLHGHGGLILEVEEVFIAQKILLQRSYLVGIGMKVLILVHVIRVGTVIFGSVLIGTLGAVVVATTWSLSKVSESERKTKEIT
jgi:hypothetical protein